MRLVSVFAIAIIALLLPGCSTHTARGTQTPTVWSGWIAPPGTDDRARVILPDTYDDARSWPVVLFIHGTGRTADDPGNTNTRELVEGLAAAGYITVIPNLGGPVPWGSRDQIDDLAAAYAQVRVTFNTGALFTVAASAGNLPALIAIADGRLPDVVGHYGVYPVTNLSHQYEVNEDHRSLIERTYGFAGASGYAAATAGHDPMLVPAQRFSGVSLRFAASLDDAAVDAEANAVGLVTKLSRAGVEASLVIGTGPNGSPSTTELEDVLSFFEMSQQRYLRP